jgi:hypothetical protein
MLSIRDDADVPADARTHTGAVAAGSAPTTHIRHLAIIHDFIDSHRIERGANMTALRGAIVVARCRALSLEYSICMPRCCSLSQPRVA